MQKSRWSRVIERVEYITGESLTIHYWRRPDETRGGDRPTLAPTAPEAAPDHVCKLRIALNPHGGARHALQPSCEPKLGIAPEEQGGEEQALRIKAI